MTSEKRLAAVTAIARKHTAANTKTKAAAKKVLVREGFYTAEGALSANYGGSGIVSKSLDTTADR